MVSAPHVGQIIHLRSWHGVVLDVFTNDAGKTILRVQTVRNVFRRLNPEFIEFDLAHDAIEPASLDDLQAEVASYEGDVAAVDPGDDPPCQKWRAIRSKQRLTFPAIDANILLVKLPCLHHRSSSEA